jgi:hypothetical protein
MTQAFRDMCLELADEPEKLARFVKLYYNDDDIEIVKKCLCCNKTYTVHEDNLDKNEFKNHCSLECYFYDTFIKNGSIEELDGFMKSKHLYSSLVELIVELCHQKGICDEKLEYIIHYPDTNPTRHFIAYFSRYPQFHHLFLKKPTFAIFDYMRLDNNIDFIKQYIEALGGLEEFKKQGKLKDFFNRGFSKYKELCIEYLEISDLKNYPNNPDIVQSIISKFGLEKIKTSEPAPFTYLDYSRCFRQIYLLDEITDEMIWYHLDLGKCPDWCREYSYEGNNYSIKYYHMKDKNRLFSWFRKEHTKSFSNKYNLFQFLEKQSRGLKENEILVETVQSFFRNIAELTDIYKIILQNLLNATDLSKIDFKEKTVIGEKEYSFIDFLNQNVYIYDIGALLKKVVGLGIKLEPKAFVYIFDRVNNQENKEILELLDDEAFLEAYAHFEKTYGQNNLDKINIVHKEFANRFNK